MPCVIGEGRRGRHVAIINKDTKRIACKFCVCSRLRL